MAPKKCIEEKKPKRKAVRTTIENKKAIIAKYESGTRVVDLATEFGMPRTTISSIIKNKDAIKAADVATGVKILTSKRSQAIEDMEKLLLVWITEKQNEMAGDCVSESIICEKAKQLHEYIRKNTPGSSQDFMASRGWFDKFKKRTYPTLSRIHLQDHGSPAKATDNEAVSLFQHMEIKQEPDSETSCGVTSTDPEDLNVNDSQCDSLKQEVTEDMFDEEEADVEEQTRLLTEHESMLENMHMDKDLTIAELNEGITMIEKCMAFWEMVDPNFERSSKVNAGLENSIACYKELRNEKKKTFKQKISLPSSIKKQQHQVLPQLSEFHPATSGPVPSRSSSKSHSAKRKKLSFSSDNDDGSPSHQFPSSSFTNLGSP